MLFGTVFLKFRKAGWSKPEMELFHPDSSFEFASVPANNNLKSRLVQSCAIYLLYFLAQLNTNLDFKLLFAGTEA